MEKIKANIDQWHQFLITKDHEILDEILDKDVVFHSPVVWTPQEGKKITKFYLMAAVKVLITDTSEFSYINKTMDNDKCILEFVTTIDGLTINGVDMIEINDEGKITSFKVMIRPLKAIHKVHEKMAELFGKK